MFKWLGQQFGKSKLKTGQLQQKELDDDLVLQDSAPQQATSDPLYKTAIGDAEQIVTSIKTRALAEAEAETTRIIAQAELEVQEIIASAEIDAQNRAEGILSAANKKAEIIEVESNQRVLQFLNRVWEEVEKKVGEDAKRTAEETEEAKEAQKWAEKEARLPIEIQEEAVEEKIEEPIQLEERILEEKTEESLQPQEEALKEKIEEPIQLEERILEEKTEESIQPQQQAVEENGKEPTPLELDSQALYTGEVELTIDSKVELRLVSSLYNYLQTAPDLKILNTKGSWDQGTTITVVLEKPIPLISIISKTPGVTATAELIGKGGVAAGREDLPLREGEEKITRIKLNLKEG